ncbi:MAG: histidine kinase [Bacillales bacterium]|jgi:GAF domain-containing protein|nr:histidine kinase [Bacillales bacterium]
MFSKVGYSGTKEEQYSLVLKQLESLIEGVDDNISNMANASALLGQFLEKINWVGFYLAKGNTLYLGPFQGLPACTLIPFGRGVCGTAAETKETQLIPNVHEFPGHIACDAASQSEIVVPMIVNNELIGVLDIDSPVLDRFDETDRLYLEKFVEIIIKHWIS